MTDDLYVIVNRDLQPIRYAMTEDQAWKWIAMAQRAERTSGTSSRDMCWTVMTVRSVAL